MYNGISSPQQARTRLIGSRQRQGNSNQKFKNGNDYKTPRVENLEEENT